MEKKTGITIGIVLGVISCIILIYAFETERSFAQILLGFLILYPLIAFISLINGKLAAFLLTTLLILGGYICIKQGWTDTLFGVMLAILLGGATYLFKVSIDQKEEAEQEKEREERDQNLQH